MIKKIFGTLSYVATVIGSGLVGAAVNDHGISPESLLNALESAQAVIGFISLAIAGGIQFLKKRSERPAISSVEADHTESTKPKTKKGIEYNE